MKILHTSDWHLGRMLYGRKRYGEFSKFLDWLVKTIKEKEVSVLLVSGDVFDTTSPGNKAQELYYRFLCRVSMSFCRHVIIISGNHDSPSFLNAPKEILKALNVHVVSSVSDSLEDEVISILDIKDGVLDCEKSLIVCAVPYLRDKDIRTLEAGESIDDKNKKLVLGIKNHYAEVVKIAEKKREEAIKQYKVKNTESTIPIISMGHLFTLGGKTIDGDGVRELYVGTLTHVGKEIFPPSVNYVALGHLHVPQTVGGSKHIRYSGSPISMGYGEANQQKKVLIVEFKGTTPNIKEINVPCFQKLARIKGSLEEISLTLEKLKKEKDSLWLEIEYTGEKIIENLPEILYKATANSSIEIQRIKNRQLINQVINTKTENETLDDLSPKDVFIRLLDTFNIPKKDREELSISYNQIVRELMEEDVNDL